MADNTEESEGGSGQRIETGNMEILMKSMADMREHQRLLEGRLGVLPPGNNPINTGHAPMPDDMLVPLWKQHQFGQLFLQYLKLAPEEFSGTPPNPEKAEEWLQHAEHVLEHVSNDRDTWVKFVTYRFRGPSRDWWNAVIKAEGGTITWDRFKVLFMDQYVPDSVRDRKFSEFMSLTKGGMSISAYNDKFLRLSRYGTELIATDEAKEKKFIRGLDSEMRKQLSCLRIKTYEDA
ncbi:uncharacterized protein LOC113310182 [Papaver somniferum]|uniref:uncharacterized protein LOC113310182 n=1 Tax=Papaver somniferum TaxID=3469 RepID=UPI000E704B46|nr:uncharacterized protein LOC113310182 [Papaver somniferum]XP_026414550.1 uncharacterized protein LOC113310182 [Papaver somniferum]XP_026414551.1 uncharacterized protein LOC113310182 [Papaver somniferum]XP_026414552.1 uncharacterized protein LOC113310182 [Papaver somniferum]XP_026414553.1 uncharacterized protein LOC113310182 [Papaver somniferum]XP_026414554.1 uncharacterized protein LOC113310182 [Papaver somniferum]XP_026414555.1 uncharacterized protein LOC113310182 [Papaver somniferum]XP_0